MAVMKGWIKPTHSKSAYIILQLIKPTIKIEAKPQEETKRLATAIIKKTT